MIPLPTILDFIPICPALHYPTLPYPGSPNHLFNLCTAGLAGWFLEKETLARTYCSLWQFPPSQSDAKSPLEVTISSLRSSMNSLFSDSIPCIQQEAFPYDVVIVVITMLPIRCASWFNTSPSRINVYLASQFCFEIHIELAPISASCGSKSSIRNNEPSGGGDVEAAQPPVAKCRIPLLHVDRIPWIICPPHTWPLKFGESWSSNNLRSLWNPRSPRCWCQQNLPAGNGAPESSLLLKLEMLLLVSFKWGLSKFCIFLAVGFGSLPQVSQAEVFVRKSLHDAFWITFKPARSKQMESCSRPFSLFSRKKTRSWPAWMSICL